MAEADAIAAQASSHFVDEEYAEALQKFTEAINLKAGCASWLVQRAATHLKLDNYTEALGDAQRAIELEPSNAKAHLRKGMAAFALEEFATAKAAFERGAALDPETSAFRTWVRKCEVELQDEAEDEEQDAEEASAAAPAPAAPAAAPAPAPPAAAAPTPPPAAAAPPPPRFRHEWYQTPDRVTLEVFARKMDPAAVHVSFAPSAVSVVIDAPNDYRLDVPLFSSITPAACKYNVLTSKIELLLQKDAKVQWAKLEGTGVVEGFVQPVNVSDISMATVPNPYAARPVAKTRQPTDWDKLEKELADEEKDEKLEGDAALNKLFQDIYKNANDDTRRAMNKSYQESNGTVLSTNWSEVGAKQVEGSPPTGMVMKKYGE